jgi:glyoxylase-like metal-dependent hydrolase (beta-lactamase superfamily II)
MNRRTFIMWPIFFAGFLAACAHSGSGGPDVRADHGIRGYQTGQSFFYVVPVDGGVVLVDTGGEESGDLLRNALEGERVLAILLTHSHNDHIAAAHLFDAPTYVGPGEEDYVNGEKEFGGFIQNLFGNPNVTAPPPKQLENVEDNAEISVGGMVFRGIHMPGHTDGSMAWLYQDVLFGGDAIFGGNPLAPAPGMFSDDPDMADASMEKIAELDFKTLLDGHNGITKNAHLNLPKRKSP